MSYKELVLVIDINNFVIVLYRYQQFVIYGLLLLQAYVLLIILDYYQS